MFTKSALATIGLPSMIVPVFGGAPSAGRLWDVRCQVFFTQVAVSLLRANIQSMVCASCMVKNGSHAKSRSNLWKYMPF
jgi:hypothetical protein